MFRSNLLLSYISLKMVATGSSETLVTTYETARRHNPGDHNLNFHIHENLETHTSSNMRGTLLSACPFDNATRLTL
jgi:hypothetical protein